MRESACTRSYAEISYKLRCKMPVPLRFPIRFPGKAGGEYPAYRVAALFPGFDWHFTATVQRNPRQIIIMPFLVKAAWENALRKLADHFFSKGGNFKQSGEPHSRAKTAYGKSTDSNFLGFRLFLRRGGISTDGKVNTDSVGLACVPQGFPAWKMES